MARKDPTNRGVYEYPKGSGRYLIQYADVDHPRRREVAATCPNHSEHPPEKCPALATARNLAKQRRRDAKTRKLFPPPPPAPKKVLLCDALKTYLLESAATKRSYTDDKRFAKEWDRVLGERGLDEIKPGDVEAWRRSKLHPADEKVKALTPATANRYVAFLKRVFNVAIRDELATDNPVRRVKLLRENNARIRFLSPEEETALKAHCDPFLWGLVLVAMDTGLRQSEQFGLRWEHINFRQGIITIPRSKHGEKRHVQMGRAVAETLRALPSRLKSEWVYPAPQYHHGRKPKGERLPHLTYSSVRMSFEKTVKDAGLEGFHWHDLRHTFVSRLVMSGADISTVKELSGHKTLAMVQRYTHLSAEHRQAAVDRLERFHPCEPDPAISPECPQAQAVGSETRTTKGKAHRKRRS